MKKVLTFMAVLVLSVVFFSQDKAFAAITVKDEDGNTIVVEKLKAKQSVIVPVEIQFPSSLSSKSVTAGNIYMIDVNGNRIESKARLYNNTKVLVTPTKPLKYSTEYGIVVTKNVLTADDKKVSAKAYSFTTEAKPKDAKLDVTKGKKVAFNAEELDVFLEVLYSSKVNKSVKWNTGINVALLGKPTTANKKEVNKVLKEITALTGIPTKVTTAKKANFQIYFGSEAAGGKHMGVKIPLYTRTIIDWKSTKKSYIYTAKAYINPTWYMKADIRKVLTNTLGFPNHTYTRLGSTFSKNTGFTEYTALDKKIIKALYSPYTPAGLTKEQLREVYRN